MFRALLIAALMLLFPLAGIGQTQPYKLTVKQMITLFTEKSEEDVNDFLIGRSWTYHEATKPTKEVDGGVWWRYEPKSNYTDRGLAFFKLNYMLAPGTATSKVRTHAFYQHSFPEIFKAMKAEVASYGMRQVKSDFYDDGGMYTDYVGKNYVCRFATRRGDYGGQIFVVYLWNRKHYEYYNL